ncbi:MAG TPA: hypothetical protein VN631_15635, partial [Negativicutes bacterium]|nr:hypothetical protein [Negativicutes bacterium]
LASGTSLRIGDNGEMSFPSQRSPSSSLLPVNTIYLSPPIHFLMGSETNTHHHAACISIVELVQSLRPTP